MEPQFIINFGGLDKLGFNEKEFLELLGIDFKKAIPADENVNFGCPKCKRSNEDIHFVYHTYEDFKVGSDLKGKDADFSYRRLNYCLCICGCLYVYLTESQRISASKDKNKK